jgi:hypothetical protein
MCRLDNQSLVRLASTCRLMYFDRPRPMTPVEEALRQRATEHLLLIPRSLPARFSGWVPFLLRRDGLAGKQYVSVALCFDHSAFIDSDGHLLQYALRMDEECRPIRFGLTRDVQF